MTNEDLYKRLIGGDRRALAKAITLVESNRSCDTSKARELINEAIKDSGNSLRIGITGRPGAGKSTFIETYGLRLIESGHKVAVLAVDPSSPINKGSLLGDKTRMEKLSAEQNAFIRPSATGGMLGGVSRKTREIVILCEAAGYDQIIIETVGVGQSEAIVSEMVDALIMLELPFAGDEVQFIKKGLAELVDIFLVHKFDGERIEACKTTAHGLRNSLNYAHTKIEIERPVLCISSYSLEGYEKFESSLYEYIEKLRNTGAFEQKREKQIKTWLYEEIKESITRYIFDVFSTNQDLREIQKSVYSRTISPVEGASQIVKKALKNESN